MAVTHTPPLGQMLAAVVDAHAARPAQRVREGDGWRSYSYADFGRRVERLAAWLIEQGVQPGDRVAIFAPNYPEWHVADFATLYAGAIVVPIFANSSSDQVAHILRDSGAATVFVGDSRQAKLLAATGIDGLRVASMTAVDGLALLDELAADAPDLAEVARRRDGATLDDTMTIIYTSGTTGQPRGAMLSHRAFAYQIDAINGLYDVDDHDQSLAFLPLAHALERIWSYYVVSRGALNTFNPDPRKIAELLPLARPNLLISVPKLYEQVYATAWGSVADDPLKKRILTWALGVGAGLQRYYRSGQQPPLALRAQLPLADKLVLKNIRDAVGGPKKVLISGGAPLRHEIEEFFSACGLLLGQGYGLTESGPMMTYFSPTSYKFGTVGYCTPGGELKIGADGEILYKGPNVMQGYWNNPEATKAAIDADGFLHTGDVGKIDEDGYLVITDRLKDIIVTSGGKNVAPQPIEGLLRTDPFFEYAVVLGNNRPYLTMLVQPTREGLESLGRSLQLQWGSIEELVERSEVLDEVKRRAAQATSVLPSFEQVKDVRLLLDQFTQEAGTLTPTLKIKRREVEQRFAQVIDDMYARRPGR